MDDDSQDGRRQPPGASGVPRSGTQISGGDTSAASASDDVLRRAAAEVEEHVAENGWERPPALFALVRTADFLRDEPSAAARVGVTAEDAEGLLPVEQESLPDGPLDEVLAGMSWPPEVFGCALTQEILILPPGAEQVVGSDLQAAADHPERREGRLSVAVTRDGRSAAVLRLRGDVRRPEDLVTGPDLAPNLAAALLATLRD